MYYFPVFIIILLQRTNATLRRLGDEMRSYSQEKSRQREEELRIEVGLFSTLSSLICHCRSRHLTKSPRDGG